MNHPDSTDKQNRIRKAWIIVSAVIIAAVLLITLVIVKPAIPDRITLLTGPVGSAYYDLGQRYAEDLRRRGLETDVTATDGVFENIEALAKGGDVVAFAPSTLTPGSGIDMSNLFALGSVGFEPLWLFYRSDLGIERIPDLEGRKIVTGGKGTVSDVVARNLIEKNHLGDKIGLEPTAGLTAQAIVDGFSRRTIDALVVTGEATSPIVKALLGAEGVSFLSFERAEAYAGLIPGVTKLVAPEGVFDLARNVPPEDANLLAATTCLLAHEDLHSSVVPMLLITAGNVREQTTPFFTTVAFPSSENVTLPLDPAARRYFDHGETWLSGHLPYKVARFLNHLGFLVVPVLSVVVVLLRVFPTALGIWTRLRFVGLFRQLEAVEKGHAAAADRSKLLSDLDRIDQASARMFVPRSAASDYVDFRQFLHDLRERVAGADQQADS